MTLKPILNFPDTNELERMIEMADAQETRAFDPKDDVITDDSPIEGLYTEEVYLKLFKHGLMEQGQDNALDMILRKNNLFKPPKMPSGSRKPKAEVVPEAPFDTDPVPARGKQTAAHPSQNTQVSTAGLAGSQACGEKGSGRAICS